MGMKAAKQTTRVRVPQVEVPRQENGIDGIVNALAEAWNNQVKDPDTRVFFDTPLSWQRQEVITRSIYRFPREEDRHFMARQLSELARAIQGAVFRWVA